MYKILSILIITGLMASCVGSGNFYEQKYTKLKVRNQSDNSYSENDATETSEIEHSISEIDLDNDQSQTESTETKLELEIETPTPEYFAENSISIVEYNHTFSDLPIIEEQKSGLDESITNDSPELSSEDETEEGENNIIALVAFILLLGSIIFPPLLIAVFILSIIALIQIKKEPRVYKNKWQALTVLIVSLVLIMIGALIFIIINGGF